MQRCFMTLVLVPLLALPALAQQQPINWSQQVEQAVAQAQQTRRPLMFWVVGSSSTRDPDVESDQKASFRDPLVVELSKRFVPVRLSRDRYRELLEKWNVSRRTNLELVFVTPDGEKIDTLAALGVTQADVLARKMVLVYRHYRQQVFDRQIKPKLESEETSDADLRQALRVVVELLILSADESVVKLLARESLGAGVRNDAYKTLAVLSTPASVKLLLERAGEDEQAAAALTQCTPDAAETMLAALGGDDPDLHLAVYHAVTRICRIRDVKRDRFWQGRNQVIKRREIERVRQIVTRTARRWRERYAEYR